MPKRNLRVVKWAGTVPPSASVLFAMPVQSALEFHEEGCGLAGESSGSQFTEHKCKARMPAKALHGGGLEEEIAFDRSSGCSRAGNWFLDFAQIVHVARYAPGRSAFIPPDEAAFQSMQGDRASSQHLALRSCLQVP